ncbi:MAG TPA: gamma-glutamyl-gamma-aminobutyrate hydrolase family protein [Pyrinomonadaceae bacterium]|nr:gamma-glutamyl-gamma-aminobutyrate hydrolase family protein [Pyrinomonadaceae bacterium]
MSYRPKIGITMRLEAATRRFYLGRDYCEAVEAAGGIPVHLGLIPNKEYIAEALSGLDGILLPGSDSDIDPARFGESPNHQLGRVVPEKDETDLLVLAEAEKNNMPFLGICYGMQALNVSRGGTLIQDIASQVPESHKHDRNGAYDAYLHAVEVSDDSYLAPLIEGREVRVNSSHHQSVNKVGRDLVVGAKAKDGIIESIQDTREGHFVFAVQWHPELSWSTDELSGGIFKLFVENCVAARRTVSA